MWYMKGLWITILYLNSSKITPFASVSEHKSTNFPWIPIMSIFIFIKWLHVNEYRYIFWLMLVFVTNPPSVSAALPLKWIESSNFRNCIFVFFFSISKWYCWQNFLFNMINSSLSSFKSVVFLTNTLNDEVFHIPNELTSDMLLRIIIDVRLHY